MPRPKLLFICKVFSYQIISLLTLRWQASNLYNNMIFLIILPILRFLLLLFWVPFMNSSDAALTISDHVILWLFYFLNWLDWNSRDAFILIWVTIWSVGAHVIGIGEVLGNNFWADVGHFIFVIGLIKDINWLKLRTKCNIRILINTLDIIKHFPIQLFKFINRWIKLIMHNSDQLLFAVTHRQQL